MADKDPRTDKEQAEGSRGTVDDALTHADAGGDERAAGDGPGITNRPAAEEDEQQRHLPPRGHAKAED